MSPVLAGGPSHGQMFFDPESDTPAPGGEGAMGSPLPADAGGLPPGLGGPPPGGPPPPGGTDDLSAAFDQLDDKQKFSTLMTLIKSWSKGFKSEQDRLLSEKATTLFQQIAANEEKANQTAVDPRTMGKAYGGPQA